MKQLALRLRRQAARLLVLGLVATLYGATRLPDLSAAERESLAERFRFVQTPLPIVPGVEPRSVRGVNPSLSNIAAWISSVGAAVALNDLDGDGHPNDSCYVHTPTNQVIVAPAPGHEAAYVPFVLSPAPLRYQPATMAPMGCLPGDLDENGTMDILVYYWGRTPIAFLRRRDGGGLSGASYMRRELVPGEERWYTNAALLADLDGDGHQDLVVGNYFADGARILDAAAAEPDHMQHSMSRAFNGGAKHLLLWSGADGAAAPDVHFSEATGVLDDEANHGWTLAIGAADLNGDLLPELYLANDFGPDRLLANHSSPGHLRFTRLEGEKRLTTPASKVLGHDSFKGMGIDFADLNGDGRLDMFVSNITSPYALEESNFAFVSEPDAGRLDEGVAPYVDRSESLGLSRSGWSWDARLADFDDDGTPEALQAVGFVKGQVNRWPELHELAMGNDDLLAAPSSWPRFQPGDDLSGHEHNPFYVRAADGRYYDLAPEIGLGESHISRGIALADTDADGRLDFAVANQWETSVFYHNVSPNTGTFLGLKLLLPLRPSGATQLLAGQVAAPDGRPAIGATATVALPDGRRLVGMVDGGSGHSGKRSFDLIFGLGDLPPDRALPVELRWRDPDGRVHRETLTIAPGWHTAVLGW